MKKFSYPVCMVLGWMMLLLTADGTIAAEQKIGALGRINPQGGVINIGIPPGNMIASILVKRGDFVTKGTTLIISREAYPNEGEMYAAEMDLKEANTAGQKAIEIKKLEESAADMELKHARSSLNRMLEGGSETYSTQAKEEREHAVKLAETKLALIKKEREQLQLNREINASRASAKIKAGKIKAQQSKVIAPIDGTILQISNKIGGSADGQPVVIMADLRSMIVEGEVYEGDVSKLSVGMQATITSKALPKSLTGRITEIGRIVSAHSRNVDIIIKLDDPVAAAKLINHEVNISIDLNNKIRK